MSKNSQQGFSLLEVIIAIFIVAVGLVGILGLASISLKGPLLSRSRLIASGLAQEGIEVVRDMRRSNLEWSDWEWYSSAIATSTEQNHLVQYDSSGLMSYSDTPLKFDPSSGLYQYDSGSNSPFYRRLTLKKISYEQVKVVVEVKWQVRGNWYYIITEDRLWNWK